MAEEVARYTDESGRELTTLNMGPQHPSTHGVLRLVLTMEGETILHTDPVIGYLHTGFEKSAESKTYMQAITLTDRMDYLNPLGNNLCYALAIEKLLDIEVPPKAIWMRVLLTELQRISSHLVWLGTSGLDLGAASVFLYCMREREMILDIFELVSGVRLMTSYIWPGGLYADVPEGFEEKVRNFIKIFPERIDEYHTLLTTNSIFLERTQGVAVMSKEHAIQYAVTGPALRASGVNWDIRKVFPYSGYENFKFQVPVLTEGDVYASYLVRMEEMRQSLSIVEQAMDGLPTGPYQTSDRKVAPPPKWEIVTGMESLIHHFKLYTEGYHPPKGEVYQRVESPRGELGFYIVSDGGNRPYRWHYRGPSFANLEAMPKLLEGALIADVVATIGSLDFVLGDIDR